MSWLRLLYWLGPWMDQKKEPPNIRREEHRSGEVRLWLYRPKKCIGTLFLIPGLHHEGPADPRLERFAKVLADAGIQVGVPFLPTALNLIMRPALLEESKRALLYFLTLVGGSCGIFSISAASIAALHLASDEDLHSKISGVMLFGGVSNWKEALLFAAKDSNKDPLNLPVIFLNLWSHMNISVRNEQLLLQAWYRFIHATWEKEEMQSEEDYAPIAHKIVQELPQEDKDIFLMGCSLLEGGVALVEEVLKKGPAQTEWLLPKPYLERLRVPLHIAHGKDDVVVPFPQAFELAKASAFEKYVYITGFYDHTGISPTMKWLRMIPQLPWELYQSIRLLRGMVLVSKS